VPDVKFKDVRSAFIAATHVGEFLCNTDITLKFEQLLDRSPQIRAQLARYL
jgi:FAD/FMN-containing dehydrogenase